MRPNDFYALLFKEANMIIKGHRQEEEQKFNLMQTTMVNAIGSCFSGKKFKPIEPFKKEKEKQSSKKKSREELLAELEQVKKSFNK